jgi:hypothetical protein
MNRAISISVLVAGMLTRAFPAVAEDRARIYVYARRETAARSFLSISCDNQVAAEVKQGLFFAVNVDPGRHVVLVDRGLPLFLDVLAGQESFVRLDWNYGIVDLPSQCFPKSTR